MYLQLCSHKHSNYAYFSEFTAASVLLDGKEHFAWMQFPPVILNMTPLTIVAKEQHVFPYLRDTPVTVLWEPLESTVNKVRQKLILHS